VAGVVQGIDTAVVSAAPFQVVVTSTAMHRLAIHVHYPACEKVKR